ncbi:hypothetical protein SAMN05660324_3955 [Klenkia brasiliensis]|uniref:Uncharacterized protein n=1 Tax=Klenkia brasiliensis TaxID=333142 RepID=A0A1G7YGR7_9ACTN|nr:hypothetical protein SAMN05660324_3955 [Klenkia brasiliensis]
MTESWLDTMNRDLRDGVRRQRDREQRERFTSLFRPPPPTPPPPPGVTGQLLRRVNLPDSRAGHIWVDAHTGRVARGDPRPTPLIRTTP